MNYYYDSSYLAHHGIKGMKWGIRRYQNDDGTLTSAGRSRYGMGNVKIGKSNMTLLPTTYRQMRHDVRKRNRNMIKDTIKGTFSKDNGLRRKDFRGLSPAPGIAYAVSKFDKKGFKDSISRNKQVLADSRQYLQNTYGDKYTYAKNRQRAAALKTPLGASVLGTSYLYKNRQNIANGIGKAGKGIANGVVKAGKGYANGVKNSTTSFNNPVGAATIGAKYAVKKIKNKKLNG